MKVRAIRSDVSERLWYPIEAMRWPNVPVVVSLVGGQGRLPPPGIKDDKQRGGFEILAEIRRRPGPARAYWWYQLGAWGGIAYGFVRTEVVELEMFGRTPPTKYSPNAWRPLDPRAWRHPLPEPLGSGFGPVLPVAPERPEEEPLDPHLSDDGWPYPGLKLRCGEPPASVKECEARILRAFRTSASRGGGISAGHTGGSLCSDIPGEMVKAALKYAALEREADEGSDSDAVRSGWTPADRDLRDWDTALSWLDFADRKLVQVLSLRAADPPWAFWQIAKLQRVSRQIVHERYARALAYAFASAIGKPRR
jgi:hypothetical protein